MAVASVQALAAWVALSVLSYVTLMSALPWWLTLPAFFVAFAWVGTAATRMIRRAGERDRAEIHAAAERERAEIRRRHRCEQ